jgi:hypothetical protein
MVTTATMLGQSSSLSPFAGPYVGEMLGRGAALASMPYQAYMGPLTAGPSELQQQAFTGLAGLGMPAASGAGSFTGAAYQPLTPEQLAAGEMPTTTAPISPVQQYMNPYIQAALEPQYEQARRQADIAQQALQSQYAKAGAYGGARQGIAEAELQRGLLDRMADITGQGYSQAYQQAADLFGREQDYGLRALAAQQTGGAQQRAIEQQGVAADIGQFREERDYPYKQVQYMQSLLQGLPISTQTYQYAEPSTASQFMSGAGGILGLLDTMGLFGN